jgi:hypothetical protein
LRCNSALSVTQGRLLRPREAIPEVALGFVAGQLGVAHDALATYAVRVFDFLPDTPPAASEGFAGAADPEKPKGD